MEHRWKNCISIPSPASLFSPSVLTYLWFSLLLKNTSYIFVLKPPYLYYTCTLSEIHVILNNHLCAQNYNGKFITLCKKKEPDTKKTRVTLTGSINIFFYWAAKILNVLNNETVLRSLKKLFWVLWCHLSVYVLILVLHKANHRNILCYFRGYHWHSGSQDHGGQDISGSL